MTAPKDCFTVYHGKLQVTVPRKLFVGIEADVDPKEAEEFRKLVTARYPWVSDNAVDVIIKNSKREMLRILDEESDGLNSVKIKVKHNDYDSAIAMMWKIVEKNPQNANHRRMLGELLMRVGKIEEAKKIMYV